MANPQIENGYTAVANEILDNLYKFSLNGTELKVISCIFRYTFGLSVTESGIENAVSVPFGKNGFTWIPYCWDWMQNFDTLIVFGDCENGIITLLDEMRKRFRGTVKAVQQQDYRGCKDANELLCKYGKDAVRRAVEQAKTVLIDRVIEIADIKAVDLFSLPKISTGIV